MAQLLNGKDVALEMTTTIKRDIAELKERNITPTLGIIRIGEDGASISYEKGATKRCEEVGAAVKTYVLPEDASEEALLSAIRKVNEDHAVHGVLLLRNPSAQSKESVMRNVLLSEKDVDGITDISMAKLYSGDNKVYAPCTAESVIQILDHYKIALEGKRVAVVGRSNIVGKPVSLLFLNRNSTVTICHSKTKDLPHIIKEADIAVIAIGRAESIGAESFRQGQIVIDVGVNSKPDGGKGICGDVKFSEAEPIVAAITPVPGGVGAVTNCILISHVVRAAKLSLVR